MLGEKFKSLKASLPGGWQRSAADETGQKPGERGYRSQGAEHPEDGEDGEGGKAGRSGAPQRPRGRRGTIIAGALLVAVVAYVGLGGPLPVDSASEPGSGQAGEQGSQQSSGQGSQQAAGGGAADEEGKEVVPDQPAGDVGGSGGQEAQAPDAAPRVRETNVSLGAPEIDSEQASISASQRTWEGSVQDTSGGERQVIRVNGPTNASFQTGLEMPSGELTVGAFTGRVEDLAAGAPAGAEYRATYNRFEPGADSEEVQASGEYFVSGENGVIARGSYVDRREGSGDRVVRTYTDAPGAAGEDGRTFSVSFEAPQDALVPEIVGYEPPVEGEA